MTCLVHEDGRRLIQYIKLEGRRRPLLGFTLVDPLAPDPAPITREEVEQLIREAKEASAAYQRLLDEQAR